jgi:transcriptional regulator with XRE-family HTH domain
MGIAMPQTEFGERLRMLREQAGITRVELAKAADMAVGSLANLENGSRTPSWPTVQALAKALGVKCTAFETAPRKGKG